MSQSSGWENFITFMLWVIGIIFVLVWLFADWFLNALKRFFSGK